MASSKKTEPFDQPGPLMLRTMELLKEQDLLKVYSDTKISFYWLQKFVAGGFKNPSVNRVQFLYEHLSKQRLI